MSRIRSHLDAIMSGNENREPQSDYAAAPRPAFPRSGSEYPRQPVSQPAPNLRDIHKSLDQLANRISTVSRNNAQQAVPAAQPAVSSQPAFQEIRQEIHKGISQVKQELGSSLDHDLKRIADGIAALQSGQNLHPGYVDQMQAELQNLNIGIRQIAEMQSAAPASQVDLSGVSQSIESGYSEIVQKLDQVLAQRGNELPSLPEINIPDYSNDLKALASRVEEVSRAVVSMSVSAGDIEGHHALERIEARLASLAKAVEAAPVSGGAQLENQLFADMANHQEMVAAELARLSQHLEALQAGGAAAAGPDYAGEMAHNLTALEERIATLADRLDGFISGGAESPAGNGHEILAVLQDLVGRVETIEQLAAQAAQEGHEGEPGSADRLAGLEAQISAIATLLGSAALNPETGDAQSPEPGSIAERLYNIEGQIAASRDIVIDMASQAAQAGTGENAAGYEAVQLSQLDEVLAEVRQIREASSGGEQNGGNLGEIAEAIQAISARLDQLEMVQAWPASQPESDMQFGGLASAQTTEMPAETFSETAYVPEALEAVEPTEHAGFGEHELPQLHESPPLAPEHETAHIAPEVGEVQADYTVEQHGHADSMMATAAEVRPPEAEAEDVPLEPGSGMPDLESLVRRATNRKRAKTEPAAEEPGDDDGINDLMAAARRAAQAASAQAQTRREREAMGVEQPGEKKRFSIGKPSMFSRKRLLTSVAVIALAYAAWAIVPKFLGGSNETEVSQAISQEQPLAAEESAGEDTTAGEEEVADAADAADTGGAAVTDDEPAAGDDMLADIPQDDPVEEASEPADGNEVLAAAKPLPDAEAETVPAMAAGSETIAIPDGMPQEIGNAALLQDAAAGDGNALFEIARRYTEGDGVDRSLETAATWYQKAADLGHGPSQYRLGNFYEKGHGVTADTDKAAEWYTKAAAAGNALAMHNLAVLNVQGLLGSEPDMETAIGWFEKAANLGVKDSQVNLGILYTRGMGVKADLEQAYKWFAIAAKGGDNDAAAKRDTVAKNMRPEQLEKARGEAEIWKPKALSRDANIVSLKESWKKGSNLERATLPEKELVRRTQAVLSKLGFDPGPADGIMGAKTEEAIKAYQQKSGLPVDGRITPALLEALSAQAV
ncbi:MAG: SEL1-like repeat protein [Nitratireductor sp.]|nr:SEL1-like repeat protein [Nitratireductor sp.]